MKLPSLGLLALASCTLGMNTLVTLFNFYYVKVFLQRYHITSSWLNIAQTFFMVCNFLIGPFLAYAQDYGFVALRNRRRLVLFAGPAFAMVFMVPWFPWYTITHTDDEDNWAPGVHLMMVLLLWNILFTIISSCNSGLFAEFSVDHHSRVRALTCNQIAASIAAAVVFPVDALSKSTADFRAFQICCAAAALVAMASFIFTGLFASDEVAQIGGGRSESGDFLDDGKNALEKEKEAAMIESQSHHAKRKKRFATVIAYLTIVSQVLQTRNFWCAVMANFMTFFRVCVTQNFLAVYTEGLISEDFLPAGSIAIATFYLVAQVTPRVIFVLTSPLIRRLGSYKTLQGSLVLVWVNAAIGLFLGTFVGYNALAGTMLFESILVSFQELFVMFYSEVIDEDVKTHKRKLPASTVIFTMTSLFIQPSTALAPMIVVRALNIGDYDHYKENIRLAPAYTKQVMFMVATCVPAVASIVSFISMYFYKSPFDRNVSSAVADVTRL